MNFLIFHLKRLLMLPVHLVMSPKEYLGSLWNGSERNRAMLMGIPAVLIAVIGVTVLLWAKFGIADSLEGSYVAKLDESSKEKTVLVDELRREFQMLKASEQSANEDGSPSELIPKDDPRRVRVDELRDQERIYLEKLVELNPNEKDYIYQLALVAFESGNVNRGMALMNMTAPLNEPGYIKGHLWLARYNLNRRVRSKADAVRNVGLALNHAEQCLRIDKGNVNAKQIKASVLLAQNQNLSESYAIFEDLFRDDPRYFRKLMELNRKLKKLERNDQVLDSAIDQFSRQLKEMEGSGDIAEKTRVWRDLTSCYVSRKKFEIAESNLIEELDRQATAADSSGRVWATRMLASVYVAWAAEVAVDVRNETLAESTRKLELFKKALDYNEHDQYAQRYLTKLANGEFTELAEEAIKEYDGRTDQNAPAGVLNELGTAALGKANYGDALMYYEKARQKAPQNHEILNNLAYTYLVVENANPKRALTLIDQGIRRAKILPGWIKNYETHFRDTRGKALMQLGRWTEAIAEFEFALVERPDNESILEALIKCYESCGLDPSPYVQRLDKVKTNAANDVDDTPSGESQDQ